MYENWKRCEGRQEIKVEEIQSIYVRADACSFLNLEIEKGREVCSGIASSVEVRMLLLSFYSISMVSPFGFSSFFLGIVISRTPFLYEDLACLGSILPGVSTSL